MEEQELIALGFTKLEIDGLEERANEISNEAFEKVKKDLYAEWKKEESKGDKKRKEIAIEFGKAELEKVKESEEEAQIKQALLKLLMQQEYLSILYGLKNDALTYANVTIKLSEKSGAGIQYEIVEEPLIKDKKTKLKEKIDDLETEELVNKIKEQRNEAKEELKRQRKETEALCKKINNPELWENICSLGGELEGATLDLAAQLEVWQKHDPGFPADQEEENCLKALKSSLEALKKIRIIADISHSAQEIYEKKELFPKVDRKDKGKAIKELMVAIQKDFIAVADKNTKAEDKKVIKEQKSVQKLIENYVKSASVDMHSHDDRNH